MALFIGSIEVCCINCVCRLDWQKEIRLIVGDTLLVLVLLLLLLVLMVLLLLMVMMLACRLCSMNGLHWVHHGTKCLPILAANDVPVLRLIAGRKC